MKKISMILLMICLNSCYTLPPKIRTQPQCAIFLTYEGQIDGKEVYSGKCRCRNYEFKRSRIGSVGASWDEGISSCNKILGWKPDRWRELYLDFDEFRMWLIQNETKE